MATEIKLWQVEEGKLVPSDVSMIDAGRTESKDLGDSNEKRNANNNV